MHDYALDKENRILYLEDLAVRLDDAEAIELNSSLGSGTDDIKLMLTPREDNAGGGRRIFRGLGPSARVRLAADLGEMDGWVCIDDDSKKLICVAVNLDKIIDVWLGMRGAIITETYVITAPKWHAMRLETCWKDRKQKLKEEKNDIRG